ncbi:hypothetical protein EDD18DRAFT_1364773 [Armillaria luteobubalina]|uniref:Uncharacterized protein n=1 Tax=Armillaria luteobubalina TaxID=153913 RepID=A0AA39P6A1_9AGAR|nr:hypothetical protein EDD18DRAFT_1364773 [Armillaria luteobubalina]
MDAEKKKAPAPSQMKISPSKGASETKVQTSARIIKNRPFRVQTQESMGQTKSPTTLKRPLQTETKSVSKFPRLEGENSRLIRLAALDSDESTFPIPFSFDPVVLSHALDLGPSRRALCHACFAAGCGTPCDRDDYLSGALTKDNWATFSFRPHGVVTAVDPYLLYCFLHQLVYISAISHQISQIQHCQSLVFSLSQIVASETRNMEILVSNLIGSLRSIRRDGTQGDSVPILEDLVQAHPILQRLIDEGLLKLKDPDVSPAFNRHGSAGDNTSSSELTNSKASTPDAIEGSLSGSQGSKDNSMAVKND